ncbi:hypothetical protein J2S78_001674 [Salibacterium salarium]|uniref:hypothetical protein n=1 Tax=Salibacterium salarium TaxID=284579 RepID=UPI00278026B0|nr:hypothetical protein [Salibacterium salarium]MDQ0299254.1 hypothetical protein [Salibacterium salarium]
MIVKTSDEIYSLLKPDPMLDHHPTLGWTLKNKNETVAIGVKMARYGKNEEETSV